MCSALLCHFKIKLRQFRLDRGSTSPATFLTFKIFENIKNYTMKYVIAFDMIH